MLYDNRYCYSRCWDCKADECNGKWHTRADADDIYLWERDGRAGTDPRTRQCGCWCQERPKGQLIHKGRKP